MSNKTILEVKEEWEKHLMKIRGVMAVGIGLTKDHQKKCIKVYISRNVSSRNTSIPKSIEGYPIEVEVRREFKSSS